LFKYLYKNYEFREVWILLKTALNELGWQISLKRPNTP
jgi:hypothetical protein